MASHAAKTVLVLEDDEMSSDVARCILQGADFTVICARQFDEAIYHVESAAKVDLALVDLKLPRGTPDGIFFARRAQLRRPALKFVFMSAHMNANEFALFGADVLFLRKPFAPFALLDTIARAAA